MSGRAGRTIVVIWVSASDEWMDGKGKSDSKRNIKKHEIIKFKIVKPKNVYIFNGTKKISLTPEIVFTQKNI